MIWYLVTGRYDRPNLGDLKDADWAWILKIIIPLALFTIAFPFFVSYLIFTTPWWWAS